MAKSFHTNDMLTVLRNGLDQGVERAPGSNVTFRANWSGKCSNPVGRELRSTPSTSNLATRSRGYEWVPGKDAPMFLELDVRCRKCPNCLRARRAMWAGFAQLEVKHSSRTWFSTFTLRPEHQFYMLTRARDAASKRGVDLDLCDYNTQFGYRAREVGRELTLMLKRIRKNTGAQVRYLLVFEPHESGDPHAHALFHESSASNPIRKSVLETEWHHGFSMHRLIETTDTRAAWYVCKYLAKDARTRIRASIQYGRNDVRLRTPNSIMNLAALQSALCHSAE